MCDQNRGNSEFRHGLSPYTHIQTTWNELHILLMHSLGRSKLQITTFLSPPASTQICFIQLFEKGYLKSEKKLEKKCTTRNRFFPWRKTTKNNQTKNNFQKQNPTSCWSREEKLVSNLEWPYQLSQESSSDVIKRFNYLSSSVHRQTWRARTRLFLSIPGIWKIFAERFQTGVSSYLWCLVLSWHCCHNVLEMSTAHVTMSMCYVYTITYQSIFGRVHKCEGYQRTFSN